MALEVPSQSPESTALKCLDSRRACFLLAVCVTWSVATCFLSSSFGEFARAKYLESSNTSCVGLQPTGFHFDIFWFILHYFAIFCYMLLSFAIFCYILVYFDIFYIWRKQWQSSIDTISNLIDIISDVLYIYIYDIKWSSFSMCTHVINRRVICISRIRTKPCNPSGPCRRRRRCRRRLPRRGCT